MVLLQDRARSQDIVEPMGGGQGLKSGYEMAGVKQRGGVHPV